jgi:hypothetical protein
MTTPIVTETRRNGNQLGNPAPGGQNHAPHRVLRPRRVRGDLMAPWIGTPNDLRLRCLNLSVLLRLARLPADTAVQRAMTWR